MGVEAVCPLSIAWETQNVAQLFASETVATFLSQTQLLSHCELTDLLDLAENTEQLAYKGGATIMPPGRTLAGLGLLLRGKASVRLVDAASGSHKQLGPLLPGDPFGEVSLLLGSGSPLAVVADDDCHALMIERGRIERLLNGSPQIGLSLAKRISTQFVQLSVLGGQAIAAPAPQPAPAATPARAEPAEGIIPFEEVGSYNVTPELVEMIPSDLVRRHRVIPLEVRDKSLVIGMVNPRSVAALADLRRVLHGLDPQPVAISGDDFSQTFVRLKLDSSTGKAQRASAGRNMRIEYTADQKKNQEKAQLIIGDEAVGLLDRIVLEALDASASDIHIEPELSVVKVRYRVSGQMVERQEQIPASFASPLLTRIKVVAELDITERRQPQDGRIVAQAGNQQINLRVSTMAVVGGEKAVIRIIDPADVMRPLHQIFCQAETAKSVRETLAKPYGAIVIAGPTGSGKSSTLYSMLNERRTGRTDSNIVTVEDPVEYVLSGVTQVPVSARSGLGFPDVLRGLMRQDPDVIMIGELRDAPTAEIMVEAALTGHLVLTSTHGNNAMSVIQRLQHFGSDAVLLSQALATIIVQRLARRLCPRCATEGAVAPAMLDNLVARKIVSRAGTTALPRPVGCPACQQSGYLGRVPVHELLIFDDGLRGTLARGATPSELLEDAKERNRFASFAQSAAMLMARRQVAPGDALLVVAE